MELSSFFPVWDKLTAAQQQRLTASAMPWQVEKGAIVHNGSLDCIGIVLVQTGQLRAYMLSEEGREITLYRLFDRDFCLLSASCIMSSIQFDVTIQAEKPSELLVIPPYIYKQLMEESAPLANFVNQIMASRFSEVMWLMEQVMWRSFDQRLSDFLLEEVSLENSTVLQMTHEAIANHLGTAREVVTRMLRYFQSEGMVQLSRGIVEITDLNKLEQLSQQS